MIDNRVFTVKDSNKSTSMCCFHFSLCFSSMGILFVFPSVFHLIYISTVQVQQQYYIYCLNYHIQQLRYRLWDSSFFSPPLHLISFLLLFINLQVILVFCFPFFVYISSHYIFCTSTNLLLFLKVGVIYIFYFIITNKVKIRKRSGKLI